LRSFAKKKNKPEAQPPATTYHFLDDADQLHESAAELSHFVLDLGYVLFVHLVEGLEGVSRVGAAPQGALMADAAAAGPAVDRQFFRVRGTFVPVVIVASVVVEVDGLERVQLLCHFLHPSAIHQFVQMQRCPAMRTLRSLFGQPPADANVATQLGAVRTQVGVSQFLHADETAKDLGEGLSKIERKM
jgi:hypothetical protein